jgi:hypothetical protein
MSVRRERKISPRRWAIAILATAIAPAAALLTLSCLSVAFAQINEGEDEEVVANLAAGRAVVVVAKDGIVVGTLESHTEADTRPPLIVPLGSYRVIVLLGAAEWVTPNAIRPPQRMDVELRHAAGEAPAFSKKQASETSDIEGLGLAFLEPLRAAAARLHRKLVWSADEALVELLLVQYLENYGPEVWSIRYGLEQEPLRGDFYRTHVSRPRYLQLYPPEKGQPHTLVEASYPHTGAPLPFLADLLRRNDPRLARLRSADAQLANAAQRLDRGEAQKIPADECLQFLRAALNSVAEENARQMIAVIHEQKGLEWVAGEEEVATGPANEKPREPGAPTLRKKP